MAQPTNAELEHAMWTARRDWACAGIDVKSELRELRERRTTWCGPEECELRNRIDKYLEPPKPLKA
jgi:hypothetical protein